MSYRIGGAGYVGLGALTVPGLDLSPQSSAVRSTDIASPLRSSDARAAAETARRGVQTLLASPEVCAEATLEHAPSYRPVPGTPEPGSMIVWGVRLPEGTTKRQAQLIRSYLVDRLDPMLRDITNKTNPDGTLSECVKEARHMRIHDAMSSCRYGPLYLVQNEHKHPAKWHYRSALTAWRAWRPTIDYVPDEQLLVVAVRVMPGNNTWRPVADETSDSSGMAPERPWTLDTSVVYGGKVLHPPIGRTMQGWITSAARVAGIRRGAITTAVPVYVNPDRVGTTGMSLVARIAALTSVGLWDDFSVVMGRWFTSAVEELPHYAEAAHADRTKHALASSVQVLQGYESIIATAIAEAEAAAENMEPEAAYARVLALKERLANAERAMTIGLDIVVADGMRQRAGQPLTNFYRRSVDRFVAALRVKDPVRRTAAECIAIKAANRRIKGLRDKMLDDAEQLGAMERARDDLVAERLPAARQAFAAAQARLDEILALIQLPWFKKPLGPLPTWAWLAIGGTVVVGGGVLIAR